MGPLFSAHNRDLPPPVIQKTTQALLALDGHPADWHCPVKDQPSAQGMGPSCQLMAELVSRAQLFDNALINRCKLWRTPLTVTERSAEAARSQVCMLITELPSTWFGT